MKRNLCLIGVAATLALALVPAAVHAETEVFHFRGKTAEASFLTTEPGGCISTWTDVFLFEDRYQSPEVTQENSPWAAVLIVRYDQCQHLYLTEVSGFANLSADAYSFDGGLHSAHLGATLEAFDYIANAPVSLTVDLTWEGIGQAVMTSSGGRWSYPHYRSTSHFKGTRREAIATGTVLLGTVNFVPDPSVEAGLGSSQYGSVTSYH